MSKSNKTIVNHIPPFLDYCKREKDLSPNSIISYSKYLNQFILWIKKYNLLDLTPEKLSLEHIEKYKKRLSASSPAKSIKTQNTYLIALRSLLSYFIEKNISSLLPQNIKLAKEEKSNYFAGKILTSNQIKMLLESPNTLTKIGLRDRIILEILISSGLRVGQLVSLSRDQLSDISREVLPWINEYLKNRKDKNKALFINYKSKKGANKRLTARSVENIVNKYGRKINLPFLITPESLRWSRALVLLNKDIEIQTPQVHKSFITKNYKNKEPIPLLCFEQKIRKDISFNWLDVENNIKKEIIWLKNNIPVLPEKYKQNPSFLKCDDCILRKIAILLTSGKIRAVEFKSEQKEDLWDGLTKKLDIKKVSWHGEEWHRKMMDVIYEYFKSQNYKIVLEPILNYGRADLEILSNSNNPLYVEVGTISLYKLWYNLSTMKNTTFLIVPSEKHIIEFKIL